MSASGRNASDPEQGLTDRDFARLLGGLGPFESAPRLAVAVSGGPDSLALTLLAARWVDERAGSVVGVTIDHGLRAESAGEARTVGSWLAHRGIAHAVIRWTGTKPGTGLQASAREARYRLLAHHRDDQAETVALRRARGSGPSGLAGMPAVAERHGFRILRPFLTVPKTRLLATLRSAGQPWLEDPSNRSPAFARGRLRAVQQGMTVPLDGAPGRRRTSIDRRIAGWLVRHARPDPLGFVDVETKALLSADPEVAAEVVRRVLLSVGGGRYPPRSASLDELLRRLRGRAIGTLAGVLVRPGPHRVRFVREARAIAAPPQLLARAIWFDHRFLVACDRPQKDVFVTALGERGWLERRRLREVRPARTVERAIGESLPALVRDGIVVAVPQLALAGPDAPPLADITVRFRPRHPLAGPAFAAARG